MASRETQSVVGQPTTDEKNEMNRHWSEHPGKLTEHASPARVYHRNDQQERVGRVMSTQKSETGFTTSYQNENTVGDIADSNDSNDLKAILAKHSNTTALNQDVMDKSNGAPNVGKDFPHVGLLDTAKSSFEQAKNGIGQGIEHAGHRLGFWNEENSTATPTSTSTATSTQPSSTSQHKDPLMGFESPNSSDTHSHSHGYDYSHSNNSDDNLMSENHTTGANPDINRLTSPSTLTPGGHGHHSTKAKTTGLSVMGVVVLFAVLLLVGCVIRRRTQRRKSGRYANLGDGQDHGMGRNVGKNGSSSGILASEFEDFELRDFGDEEEGIGGRRM